MGGIAEVLANEGYQISGSDLAPNPVTQQLMNLGRRFISTIARKTYVMPAWSLFSSAISADNPEIVALMKRVFR